MSDAAILRLSYKTPRLFSKIFDRHNRRFLAIAKRALNSEENAEDAVQETFVRIYKYGRTFLESKGDFKSWSNTILRNCIIDELRKKEKSPSYISEEMEAVLEAPDYASLDESDNYVNSIFDKIGPAKSYLLRLRFVLGKSYKEIGKILRVSSGTARVRIHRAKKAFVEIHQKFSL